MKQTSIALKAFFSGFGLPAYPEGGVPTYEHDANGTRVEVKPPYITYQLIRTRWGQTAPFYARVWYRSTNYDAINAVVDAIEEAIGEGTSIPTDRGAVYIYMGDPFCQYQDMAGDGTLKCAYLSMSLSCDTDYRTPPPAPPAPDAGETDDADETDNDTD